MFETLKSKPEKRHKANRLWLPLLAAVSASLALTFVLSKATPLNEFTSPNQRQIIVNASPSKYWELNLAAFPKILDVIHMVAGSSEPITFIAEDKEIHDYGLHINPPMLPNEINLFDWQDAPDVIPENLHVFFKNAPWAFTLPSSARGVTPSYIGYDTPDSRYPERPLQMTDGEARTEHEVFTELYQGAIDLQDTGGTYNLAAQELTAADFAYSLTAMARGATCTTINPELRGLLPIEHDVVTRKDWTYQNASPMCDLTQAAITSLGYETAELDPIAPLH